MASSLYFETQYIRRLIIAAYWVIAIFAACVWWSTTSITRLTLPESKVSSWATQTLCLPLNIAFDKDKSQEYVKSFQKILSQRLSSSAEACLHPQVLSALTNKNVYQLSEGAGPYEVRGRTLVYPSSSSTDEIASTLANLVIPKSSDAHEHVIVKQSPSYRLAFSLLNEDASMSGGITTWNIEALFDSFIRPITQRLVALHNFTIESQVRYHAPLAFEPQVIHSRGEGGRGLSPTELTVFVNSAEWSLASGVSDDPVLHFVTFVPSPDHRPLHIMDSAGQVSHSKSFTVPQWGGIVILNPDDPTKTDDQLASAFATFHAQLRALIGVPALPSGVLNAFPEEDISDWQLDNVLRRRIWESARETKDTLSSIVKLVHQIENMPIGPDVRDDVQGALNSLDEVFARSGDSLEMVVVPASRAYVLSSKAFFNPNMLALLYFPMEHIYAVYAPLFVPIGIPLLAAVVREFKRWREAGRAAPPVPPQ